MYNYLVYTPIHNTLIFLYTNTLDLGVSIILLTLIVKVILLPLNIKAQISAKHTQDKMKVLKPKIDEINNKHKDDKITASLALRDLYKEHNFNPASSLLSIFTLFIQIPILFALYKVLSTDTVNMNPIAFGLFDASHKLVWMGILVGISMFVMAKVTMVNAVPIDLLDKKNRTKEEDLQLAMSKMMKTQFTYVMPFIIAFTSAILPAALGIYFIVSNLFAIVQYYIIEKIKNRVMVK